MVRVLVSLVLRIWSLIHLCQHYQKIFWFFGGLRNQVMLKNDSQFCTWGMKEYFQQCSWDQLVLGIKLGSLAQKHIFHLIRKLFDPRKLSFVNFCGIPSNYQELLLTLQERIILGGALGPYWVLQIKFESDICKTSAPTHCTIILVLQKNCEICILWELQNFRTSRAGYSFCFVVFFPDFPCHFVYINLYLENHYYLLCLLLVLLHKLCHQSKLMK